MTRKRSGKRYGYNPCKLTIEIYYKNNKGNHLCTTQDEKPLPHIRLDESAGRDLVAMFSANNNAGIGEWSAVTCNVYLRRHPDVLKDAHGILYSPRLLKSLAKDTHAALNWSAKPVLRKNSDGPPPRPSVEYSFLHQLSAGEQHVDVAIIHSHYHPVFLLRPRVRKGFCGFLESSNSPLAAYSLNTKTVHSYGLRRGDRLVLGSQALSYVPSEVIRKILTEVGPRAAAFDIAREAYKYDETTVPKQAVPVNPSTCVLVACIP